MMPSSNPQRLAFIGLALTLAALPQAPSARQVLARTLTARGGAARFAAIRTMTVVATLALPGGPASLLVRSAAPNLFRIELHLSQGVLVQGFDGQRAWQINPGQTKAHWLTGAAARQVEDQALGFVDLAVAPERNGTRVADAGSGTLRGHAYRAVRFTLKTGDEFVQYYDAQSGLAFYEQYSQHPAGFETIGAYQRIAGLAFPMRRVSQPDAPHPVVLQWRRIVLNRSLPPALFQIPRSKAGAGRRLAPGRGGTGRQRTLAPVPKVI